MRRPNKRERRARERASEQNGTRRRHEYEIDRTRKGKGERREREREREREGERKGEKGGENREKNGVHTRRTERKDTPGACAATSPGVREKDRRGWLNARDGENDRERREYEGRGARGGRAREGGTYTVRLVGQSFLLRRSFAAVRF